MKIICPSCGTKYLIRDEKIRGKTVKMKCRKCSASIYIRDPALGEPFIFLGRPPDTIAPQKRAGAGYSSKKGNPVKTRWYALHDGNRIGPFSNKMVLEKLKNGEITPKTFMWKPDLQKWRRAEKIDDFRPLLQEFQQWVDAQAQERTIVSKIPIPEQDTSSVGPPPMPAPAFTEGDRISEISNLPQESNSEISDVANLFGTAKIKPVSEDAIRASTEQLTGSDLHEVAESPEEKQFFTKVFQAPELDIHHEDNPLEKLAEEKKTPRKETLREFSVLMRIEQKSKKRNLIYAVTGILIIGLVVGATIFFSAHANRPKGLVFPKDDDGGKIKISRYTVISKPPVKQVPKRKSDPPAIIKSPVHYRKKSVIRNKVQHHKRKKDTPSKKDLAYAKHYGSLFLNSGKIGEAAVHAKKHTVVSMPKIKLNKNGMNIFLQGKTKRLAICSRRKDYLQGQTVKLILNFTIMSTGKVSSVIIRQPDGLNDPGLFNCIKRKVKAWVFPQKKGRKPLSFNTTLLL